MIVHSTIRVADFSTNLALLQHKARSWNELFIAEF